LFSCHVIDYGPWPAQRSRIFVSRNASPSLEQVYPGGEEAAVFAGLTALVAHLMDREWRRFDGAALPLARIAIDEGWNTSLIRRFIRGSPHHDRLVPSQGIGLTVAKAAMADWSRKAGEKKGENWLLRAASSKDRLRTLLIDANSWKSRVAGMLTRPMGQKGGVTLYGTSPAEHELLAVHLASETPTLTEGNGRKINVWNRRPDRENHLWDCLIGAATAASLEGLSPLALFGGPCPQPPRKRMSFSELQRRAQMRR
jgi:phage terminase large subunit GpA-like protein